MEKPTATVSLWTPMVPCMRESGSMSSNMDTAQSAGTIIRSSIRECLLMAKNPEMEGLSSKGGTMRETSLMASFMGMANITLRIVESFMRASLRTIIWTAKV